MLLDAMVPFSERMHTTRYACTDCSAQHTNGVLYVAGHVLL